MQYRSVCAILLPNLRFGSFPARRPLRKRCYTAQGTVANNMEQRETSMLTFESTQTQGANAIAEKLAVRQMSHSSIQD